MPENILDKIIKKKIEKIHEVKKNISISSLLEKIEENNTFVNFKEKIENNIKNNKISIIAEIKKASPSAGIIIKDYDPVNIAQTYYNNKVTCLSVLTEENFFYGNLIHISKIKKKVNLPVLCKDFFVDKFQVYQAKSYGADAILIILAGISENLANTLYEVAIKLDMSVIVEVHTVEEAKKALNFKNSLIGINNRNLKNLNVSLDMSLKLSKILNSHKNPLISESGINSTEDLKYILKNAKIHNFLIGESLLKSQNIGLKLKQFTQISL